MPVLGKRRYTSGPAAYAPAGGAPPYAAVTTNFDGTNDWLSRASGLTSAVDGKLGTLSFWIDKIQADGQSRGILRDTAGRLQINHTSGNLIQIVGQSSGGTTNLTLISTSQIAAAGGWYHILASWDLLNGLGHLYINDADVRAGSPTLNNGLIDYTTADLGIYSNVGGTSKFQCDATEFYFNFVEYVDITVEANRRKFIDAAGKPVDLGADGSTPTGSQPIIYLKNPHTSYEVNLGYGGDFIANGSLTAGSSSPSD